MAHEDDAGDSSLASQLTHLELVIGPSPRGGRVSVEVKKEHLDEMAVDDERSPRNVLDSDSRVLQLVASFLDFHDCESHSAFRFVL